MKNPFRVLRERIKSDTIEVAGKSGTEVGLAMLEAAADWWDENNEKFTAKIRADGEVEVDLSIKMRLPDFSLAIEDVAKEP